MAKYDIPIGIRYESLDIGEMKYLPLKSLFNTTETLPYILNTKSSASSKITAKYTILLRSVSLPLKRCINTELIYGIPMQTKRSGKTLRPSYKNTKTRLETRSVSHCILGFDK